MKTKKVVGWIDDKIGIALGWVKYPNGCEELVVRNIFRRKEDLISCVDDEPREVRITVEDLK